MRSLFFALCPLAHSPLILTVSTLSLSLSPKPFHTLSRLSLCAIISCSLSVPFCAASLSFRFFQYFSFFLRLALGTFIDACLLLFSSITVSFAALRLFCCFAFVFVRPLRSFIRSARGIRMRVYMSDECVCVCWRLPVPLCLFAQEFYCNGTGEWRGMGKAASEE